jgi:hypothetical protein
MLLAAFICFLIIAFTIKFGKKCVRELFPGVFHIKAGGGGESFVFRFIDSESRDLATYPNRRKKARRRADGPFSEDQEGRMVTVG